VINGDAHAKPVHAGGSTRIEKYALSYYGIQNRGNRWMIGGCCDSIRCEKTQLKELKIADALQMIAKNQFAHAEKILIQIQHRQGADAGDAVRCLAHLDMLRNQRAKAIERLEQAVSQFGPDYKTGTVLAELKMDQGDVAAAIQLAEDSLSLHSDNRTLRLSLAIWKSSRDQTPHSVRKNHEAWSHDYLDRPSAPKPQFQGIDRDPHKKLKIGYVSGDLKNHAVRYFIEPYFKHHHPTDFEIHVFMTGVPDVITDILKEPVAHWHDVQSLSAPALHQQILDLGIDILVDLSGHTAGDRLPVFALRAAPVQVTWWGFMQTLGMKEMDYRLTDHLFCPPGVEAHYTEQLCRLSCLTAYTPPLNCEQQHASPWHDKGFVTMVSLNHTRKISQNALLLWRQVLEDNPNSGLIIVSTESTQEGADAWLKPRLASLNMPLSRIAVTPRLNLLEFMNLGLIADFALDSMPISGGVTTFHTLWMGLPVLTLRPDQPMPLNAYTANILQTVGLDECICESREDFLLRAAAWIRQPEQLDGLRQRCRSQLQSSPYMDHASRVLELEQEYRRMWHKHLESA